jgi:Mn2+/Fe2+ NRAMP family transporter
MGRFVNPWWLKAVAWPMGVLIALLNIWLLGQVLLGI